MIAHPKSWRDQWGRNQKCSHCLNNSELGINAVDIDKLEIFINPYVRISSYIQYFVLNMTAYFTFFSCLVMLSCHAHRTSYRQSLLQFSSVIPSSSSPQTLTDEKMSATSTAKQQRRAKMAMHFCWFWKDEWHIRTEQKSMARPVNHVNNPQWRPWRGT